MDNKIEVKFGVRLNELFSGLTQANSAVKSQTDLMKSHVSGLGDSFGQVKTALIGFSAILGGGALFAAGISETKELTGEAVKLAKVLGITTEESSVLNVGLRLVGVSADAYAGANMRLTRQLKSNEAGLQAMGVQTRNANGELKNGQEIVTSAVEALKGYKEGTDRNLAAQAMFGRGAAEATALMKLNNEVMEKAKQKAEALGLVIGPQQAGEVRAYREAMYEVNLVLTGLQNAIGQALIPVLTELAEFFSSTGPARVKVMQIVMAGIADVFRIVIDTAMTLKDVVMGTFSCIGDAISDGAGKGITAMQLLTNVFAVVKIALLGLELSFVIAFEFIGGLIEGLVANLKLLARVAIAAFNLDWPGVKSAWAQGAADIEAIVDGSATRIAAKAAQISDQMQRAALGQSINEGKKYSAKKPGPAGKLFEGEDKGGDDKKDKSQMSVWEAANAADKAHYELTNGLRLRDLSEDVAYWKQKAGLATTSADDRTKALAKAAQAELALMKKNVAEGKAMSEQVVSEAERAALDGVEFVRAGYESKTALGEVSAAQMLVIERGLEDERADIQRMAQAARIALVEQDPNHSPAALQREKDKLLEVERAHAAKLLGIAQQSRIEQGKFAKDFKGGLEASFAGVIKTFTTGTMTIGSLFRNMGKAILNSMIDVFVKIAAKWAAMQVANLVMSKATAAGEIATEVSKAGAGGVASMAAAPFPLNLTAPAFGASMAALAASFSVASAAGGFDIPAGMNPLTQLHQKEMVLPAEHADTIRGLSSGGGGNINVTISGQQLAGGFFLAHQSELVAALKKARRNFQF